MRRALAPLLLLTALVGSFASGASAQGSATLAITIQAGVANGLTVLADRDLDFGAVVAGTTASVGVASANAGKLHVVGQQNRRVNVTLTPPAYLRNAAASDSIRYNWAAAYNPQVNLPTDPGTIQFATLSATFRLLDTSVGKNYGQAYIWVFGSVNVGAVGPGLYTGTFTVSAAYN